jgi:hypothetical protein
MNTIEPITAMWTNGSGDTAEQVPVAVLQAIDGSRILCVRGDTGELTVIPIERIKTDWRFDADKSHWVDISVPDDEPEPEDDDET